MLLALLLSAGICAQVPGTPVPASGLRVKVFPVAADSILLDSLSIVPGTFNTDQVPPESYRLDAVRSVLYWLQKPAIEKITVTYRVFPFRLQSASQRLSYDSVMNNFYVKPFEFNRNLTNEQRGVFDFGSLKAEGSLGRQIGFGNRQDAVVNSSLNLQLSGMLGDSIEIQAAITDNNIPIQPDGNTQQLNEFDQVFLQFKKRGWQLNLGDIDIRQQQSYFLNFYKRLQGVAFRNEQALSPRLQSRTLVSGSVAKGKFSRQLLEPQEGNQGPYRLRGPNNELFFVVLANTERVFYDGQLLQRGEDQDYVINYNTAEITFTPKRMITKDSRIQVEFEYAERNYLNTNLYLSQELEFNQKLKLRLGAFNNADARNSQINQILDNRQKQFLADLGDSIQKAYYPTAVIDTFAADKILYEKVYSGTDSFYVYSTDPQRARYNLSFIDVGPGKGDYMPDFNGANGKVYYYLPPVGGIRQGQYEPVQVIVAPRRQQIVNLGLDYSPDKHTLLKAEIATSNNDVNTFSSKNNGDDRGWAGKFQLNKTTLLTPRNHLELITGIDHESVQRKFSPLERLRNVEFSRDWGLQLATTVLPVDEHVTKALVGIRNNKEQGLSYQLIRYSRSDDYKGLQHQLKHNALWKGWRFSNQFVYTGFDYGVNNGKFFRPTIDLSKELKKWNNWRTGVSYSLEKSASRFKQTDTLVPAAFNFDVWSAYLKSDETKKNRYALTFFTRSDKYAAGKDFLRGDRSLNLNLQTQLEGNTKRQFYLNATFRKLKVYNNRLSGQKEDETILGRAEYVMNEMKGFLTGNVLYEVGAGQEQRRDFAYLEVPAGTGQYAWNDYNGDNIQQLNEFELAAFADQAKFIRVFTPTNDFIKANYITLNYRLDLNPRVLLAGRDQQGLKKFIARFNLLSSFQSSRKSLARGSFEFNPFKYTVEDTALITLGNTILNTLSFNRFSSIWGMDLTFYRNNGKSLLTYGYETRKISDWSVKARWNLSRSVSLTMGTKTGVNALFTPQFANRNYELSITSIEPAFVYIKGTKFRVQTSYKFDRKKNLQAYGGERSISHAFNFESRYNILQRSSVTGKFTYNRISFNAVANTTVSYIMLDGLLPGNNLLWSLGFNKRLVNNLELNFQYDGRRAGTARTVHLGKAGVTALF